MIHMEKPKDFKSPLRIIREKCLDCQGGSVLEVKACSILDCALWYHRFGHRPNFNDPLLIKPNFEGKHNLEAIELIKQVRGDWVRPKPEMSFSQKNVLERLARGRERLKAAARINPSVADDRQRWDSATIDVPTAQSDTPTQPMQNNESDTYKGATASKGEQEWN